MFPMVQDLADEISGRDVIITLGGAVLRLLADRAGLTGGLSRALGRPGFLPVHDRAGYWPMPRC
jgi:hypothetical protein